MKTSRPGLWFPTIWLYILPLGGYQFWQSEWFWIGLFYVCFPLNFLIYGWNDTVDFDTDQINPRKGTWLFGAKGTKNQLKNLPRAIVIVQLISYPLFVIKFGWKLAILYLGIIVVLWAYNFPKRGFRNIPFLDLIAQFGYLLVVPLSILINGVQPIPAVTYGYLCLFAVQSQLMGEVMDIEPDRRVGRTTSATFLGLAKTKILIILIVFTEAILIIFLYKDLIFGGMFIVAVVWLILDLLVIFKTEKYTLGQMKLFGVGSNAIAFSSMLYVWWSGCLLTMPN